MNQKIYKLLMKKKLKNYNMKSHDIFTYVNDTQHIVASENTKEMKNHIQDMRNMIIQIYRHNSLQLNGNKTEFVNFTKDNNSKENSNFSICDDKGNIIIQKPTIKVLGYIINHKNDLENHILQCLEKLVQLITMSEEPFHILITRIKRLLLTPN